MIPKRIIFSFLAYFLVVFPGYSQTVSLETIPVDALYLSDFDPNDISSAPLLFIITVINENISRDIIVELTVSGSTTGILVLMKKSILSLTRGQVVTFSNREFDSYSLSSAGSNFLDNVMQTGIFPADTYTYRVLVKDAGGGILDEDEDINITTNPTSDLDLISPGILFGDPIQTIINASPFFQWFSQLNRFDFALYPINSGQLSEEDIVQNRPIYQETNLQTNSILYPASAEKLEEGKSYAWQVKGYFSGSGKNQVVISPVFWFSLQSTGANISASLERIEVIPNEITLAGGSIVQFLAQGYTIENEIVNISPQWKIIPSVDGEVDERGLFIAGKHPSTIAVVATFGDLTDYSTVTVLWAEPGINMKHFIEQLFGLPDIQSK